MKYSVKGNLRLTDGSAVVSLLNTFTLWGLSVNNAIDRKSQEQRFIFEVWVDTEVEKTNLFNALKPYVNEYGEEITWHFCSHDEPIHAPCDIIETYRG